MVRVTEQMMFQSLTQGVLKNQERLFEAQQRLQSGQRVRRASDDPIAAGRGLVMDQGLRRLGGMEKAATAVELELLAGESALGHADGLVTRAREIAIHGANETLGAEDRAILAEEVDGLLNTLLASANTQVGGVYVFAGYRSDAPPFQSDGTYVGDQGVRDTELAPGHQVAGNVPGSMAFGSGAPSEIFGVLRQLRDDLAANDPDATRSRLPQLDASREQLGQARATLGTDLARLDQAEVLRTELQETLRVSRSEAVELDATTGYTDLLATQSALRAALAQAARILAGLADGPSL